MDKEHIKEIIKKYEKNFTPRQKFMTNKKYVFNISYMDEPLEGIVTYEYGELMEITDMWGKIHPVQKSSIISYK
jgi:hypothetical protein